MLRAEENSTQRQCRSLAALGMTAELRLAMPRMPDWLEPMAATLTEERFSGPEWIFERKFDGIRGLAFKQGKNVVIYSRNRLRSEERRGGKECRSGSSARNNQENALC